MKPVRLHPHNPDEQREYCRRVRAFIDDRFDAEDEPSREIESGDFEHLWNGKPYMSNITSLDDVFDFPPDEGRPRP